VGEGKLGGGGGRKIQCGCEGNANLAALLRPLEQQKQNIDTRRVYSGQIFANACGYAGDIYACVRACLRVCVCAFVRVCIWCTYVWVRICACTCVGTHLRLPHDHLLGWHGHFNCSMNNTRRWETRRYKGEPQANGESKDERIGRERGRGRATTVSVLLLLLAAIFGANRSCSRNSTSASMHSCGLYIFHAASV